jgi:hypothetical protein
VDNPYSAKLRYCQEVKLSLDGRNNMPFLIARIGFVDARLTLILNRRLSFRVEWPFTVPHMPSKGALEGSSFSINSPLPLIKKTSIEVKAGIKTNDFRQLLVQWDLADSSLSQSKTPPLRKNSGKAALALCAIRFS